MNIEYISDTGSRHEWRCVHCEANYVVTFHYMDGSWSAQRIRDDGEREVLDRSEADDLLGEFPRERALQLTDTTSSEDGDRLPAGLEAEIDSSAESIEEGNVSFGATRRSKDGEMLSGDSDQPAA